MPDWAIEAMQTDAALRNCLFAYCLRHEALFFRSDDREGATDPPTPRVVVVPTSAPGTDVDLSFFSVDAVGG